MRRVAIIDAVAKAVVDDSRSEFWHSDFARVWFNDHPVGWKEIPDITPQHQPGQLGPLSRQQRRHLARKAR